MSEPPRLPGKTNGQTGCNGRVAILPPSAVCGPSFANSTVPLSLTVIPAIRPLLLAPTNYAQIEQSLLKLKQPLNQPRQEHSASSEDAEMAIKRDRKRNPEPDTDSDELTGDDESNSNDSWNAAGGAAGKVARSEVVAVDYSVTSSSQSSSESTSSRSTVSKPGNTPRRHTGPRKPRVHVNLTPEEEARRHTRRERNKYAAAKCRQKRVDLTNQLLAETEELESVQTKLKNDIKGFQREKDELEFILEAHRLHCGIGQSGSGNNAALGTAVSETGPRVERQHEGKVVIVVGGSHIAGSPLSSSVPLPIKSEGGARRPNSLLATTRLLASSSGGGSQVAGVSITTPSAGINVLTLGLESMLDGHTGLTPITGLPVALTGLSTPVFAIPASVTGIVADGGAAASVSDSLPATSTV